MQDCIDLVVGYLDSLVCTTGNHSAGILWKLAAVYSSLVNFHCYQKPVLWFLPLITNNQTVAESSMITKIYKYFKLILVKHTNKKQQFITSNQDITSLQLPVGWPSLVPVCRLLTLWIRSNPSGPSQEVVFPQIDVHWHLQSGGNLLWLLNPKNTRSSVTKSYPW